MDASGFTSEEIKTTTFFTGEGCEACNDTGYAGRQGLYEVMAMNSELRQHVLKGASTDEIKATAVADGMITLRMDGLQKVCAGITTLDEVIKETSL